MRKVTGQNSGPPLLALVAASYGAVLGSIFPVITVMTLPDISAGLRVAADSAALVNTFHNVGSVAGILITPTVVATIGRGRTMALAGLGFALAAIACALSTDLTFMIIARVFHGFFGGALPLMFMLIVMTSLRPCQGQFEGMSLFATSTTLFFGFAALVGGWLVDHAGWRMLFWVQALAALPYIVAASRSLPQEKGDAAALRRADWPTYTVLTLGLALLVVSLSEGERHFWFQAWWVTGMLLAGAALVVLGVLGMRHSDRPLLMVSVFSKPTFTWAIIMSLLFRFGSLFALFIVPQYLSRLQNLRPAEFGAVLAYMSPATAVGLLGAYLAAKVVDSRALLSLGLGAFALASWLCYDLTSDWAFDQLRIAAAIAGLGMGFFSVAILRFATFGATMIDGPTVGLIFNMTRVFGIVGGSAILSHMLVEREKFHSAIINDALGATDPAVAQRISASAGALSRSISDPVLGQAAGVASLGRAASGQAFTLAFADTLYISAVVLGFAAVLVWALPFIPMEQINNRSTLRRSPS